MAFNGAGVFQLVAGNPVVTGTVISSTWANNTLSDIANNGLTNCITKDGQQTVTADIPFNAHKLSGVGNGALRTDAPNIGQVQDGGITSLISVAGTDTITANTSPTFAAYTAGQTFDFIAAGANMTGTVTLNVNGIGAKPVTKFGAVALIPGDIISGQSVRVRYDGTQFQITSQILPGRVLLASAVASNSASVDFTGLFTAAYIDYEIEWQDVVHPTVITGNSDQLWVRVSQSGVFQTAGNYLFTFNFVNNSLATGPAGASTAVAIPLYNGQAGASPLGSSGRLLLCNPLGVGNYKRVLHQSTGINSPTGLANYFGGGAWAGNSGALDGIRMMLGSSNIVSGTFKLYGVRA